MLVAIEFKLRRVETSGRRAAAPDQRFNRQARHVHRTCVRSPRQNTDRRRRGMDRPYRSGGGDGYRPFCLHTVVTADAAGRRREPGARQLARDRELCGLSRWGFDLHFFAAGAGARHPVGAGFDCVIHPGHGTDARILAVARSAFSCRGGERVRTGRRVRMGHAYSRAAASSDTVRTGVRGRWPRHLLRRFGGSLRGRNSHGLAGDVDQSGPDCSGFCSCPVAAACK
jgi:hypothetical protein